MLADFRKIVFLQKKASGSHLFQRFLERLVPESLKVKFKERKLKRYLRAKLVPIAKSLSYFKVIHCEPETMHFCNLDEGILGTRSLSHICLNKRYYKDLRMPSVLSHETAHALSASYFDNSLVTLLGLEIDARMALEGFKFHKISLYEFLRRVIFHVSYLKAKSIGQIERWKDFVKELYGNKITMEKIEAEIERFEKSEDRGMLFSPLSEYTLLPYLAIKGAARANTTYVFNEYDLFGQLKSEIVEIPALMKIWNEVM